MPWIHLVIVLALLQVLKTGVTHYFSMAAANRDFGYTPEPRTLEGAVKWFRERGHGRRMGTQRSSWLTSLIFYSVLLLALFFIIMGFLPVVH